MSKSYHKLALCFALLGGSLVLSGCNSTKTKGWASKDGTRVSKPRLVSAQGACNYESKRARALRLLDTSSALQHSNPRKARTYEKRAARVIANARRCLRKKGIHR